MSLLSNLFYLIPVQNRCDPPPHSSPVHHIQCTDWTNQKTHSSSHPDLQHHHLLPFTTTTSVYFIRAFSCTHQGFRYVDIRMSNCQRLHISLYCACNIFFIEMKYLQIEHEKISAQSDLHMKMTFNLEERPESVMVCLSYCFQLFLSTFLWASLSVCKCVFGCVSIALLLLITCTPGAHPIMKFLQYKKTQTLVFTTLFSSPTWH